MDCIHFVTAHAERPENCISEKAMSLMSIIGAHFPLSVTTWMNLEDIILCEVKHRKGDPTSRPLWVKPRKSISRR